MRQMLLVKDSEWDELSERVHKKFGIKMFVSSDFGGDEYSSTLRDFIRETPEDISLFYYRMGKIQVFTTCQLSEEDKVTIGQFYDTDTFATKDNQYIYPTELIEKIKL